MSSDNPSIPRTVAQIPPSGARTPAQIRDSIEHHRKELGRSVETLKAEVEHVKDWRGHIQRNKVPVIVGAALAGFVIGGGFAALGGLFSRRR